ncbi:MAG: hypothetical protein K0R72_891 [Clostridia bacterium]|jgi:hypothetical protein|nr:hypothetical protein [Clostridia bacterium]
MKKKIIIISTSVIALLTIVILASYILTKNSELGGKKSDNIQEQPLINSNNNEEKTVDPSEYIEINKDSQLAREIYNFVPKYLQNTIDKMSGEYILYSAISRLEETQSPTISYMVGDEKISGYRYDTVLKAAKEIYGNSIKIDKKDEYKLPIGYSYKDDAFCKYAMGFGSSEEFQIIKELKENDKTYKLTLYALSIEYDINDLTHIFISTKNTYKLYKSSSSDLEAIRKSMEEYVLNGIDLDPTNVANEYKNSLPLIEYELEKLDDRGTKYFVKNVKLIFD